MPSFPYVVSPGHLPQTVQYLRRSFPKQINAATLKKLGIAPNNESYVINVLKFLGVVDEKGAKVDQKAKVFLQPQDDAFASEFENVVKDAYSELFNLHGDASWALDQAGLVRFFRTTDHSSDIVGKHQAKTFSVLAGLCGHGEPPKVKGGNGAKAKREPAKKAQRSRAPQVDPAPDVKMIESARVGLTVRIEVNLPAEGNQETYDRIFRSIRENLIDAK